MPDFDYVCGMAADTYGDPDLDCYDPPGHCGGGFGVGRGAHTGRPYASGNARATRQIACKHCGSTDVRWRLAGGGWRLFNTEREHPGNRFVLHQCLPQRATADDFDDVSEGGKQ